MDGCTATLPTGELCGVATNGNTWCDKHTPELRRKYLKYKALECTIDLTRDVTTLSDDRLQTVCELLFRAILLRQEVNEKGYGGYADPGHEKRIAIMDAYLCQVQTELLRRHVQSTATTADTEPDRQRKAQATSSRQTKGSKAVSTKNSGANLPELDTTVATIMEQFTKGLLSYVIDTGHVLFTEKFGDIGPQLFDIAMCMANQVVCVTYRQPGSSVHTAPKAMQPGYIQANFPLNMVPSNRDVVYCFFVVMHSFRIDVIPTINNYEAPIDGISAGLTAEQDTISGGLGQYENNLITVLRKSMRNQVKRMQNWFQKLRGAMKYPLPQLDVAFCLKIQRANEKFWCLMHIKSGTFRFISAQITGAVFSLKDIKRCNDIAVFAYMGEDRFNEWCASFSPRSDIPNAVQVALPTCYGIIPMLGRKLDKT